MANNFGIKTAKPAKDVHKDSNLYDFNLWSKNPIAKIATEGSGDVIPDEIELIDYSAFADNDATWIPYISRNEDTWYLGGFNCPLGFGYAFLSAADLTIDPDEFFIDGWPDGVAYYKYFVIVDSTTDTVGSLVTGDEEYGIKISKEGVNVLEAADRNLVYSSRWKGMKIVSEGNGTTDVVTGTATVAHGLDFIPAFLVYEDDTTWKGAGFYALNHLSNVDATNLNIVIGGAGGQNFRYKLFANPLIGTSNTAPDDEHYGVKIAEGVHEADHDDLAFTSSLGTMQVWSTVNLFMGADADDTYYEDEVAHGLGFTPAFIGLVSVTSQQATAYFILGGVMNIVAPDGKGFEVEIAADNTKFYMRIKAVSGVEQPVGGTVRMYALCYEKLV